MRLPKDFIISLNSILIEFPLIILFYYIIYYNADPRFLADRYSSLVSRNTAEEMWTSLPDNLGRKKLG